MSDNEKKLDLDELEEVAGGKSDEQWDEVNFYASSEYELLYNNKTEVAVYYAQSGTAANAVRKTTGTPSNYFTRCGVPCLTIAGNDGNSYSIGAGSFYFVAHL